MAWIHALSDHRTNDYAYDRDRNWCKHRQYLEQAIKINRNWSFSSDHFLNRIDWFSVDVGHSIRCDFCSNWLEFGLSNKINPDQIVCRFNLKKFFTYIETKNFSQTTFLIKFVKKSNLLLWYIGVINKEKKVLSLFSIDPWEILVDLLEWNLS